MQYRQTCSRDSTADKLNRFWVSPDPVIPLDTIQWVEPWLCVGTLPAPGTVGRCQGTAAGTRSWKRVLAGKTAQVFSWENSSTRHFWVVQIFSFPKGGRGRYHNRWTRLGKSELEGSSHMPSGNKNRSMRRGGMARQARLFFLLVFIVFVITADLVSLLV